MSAVTFIYIESTSDLAIKKPPLPDKREQKDILKRKVGYKKKALMDRIQMVLFLTFLFLL